MLPYDTEEKICNILMEISLSEKKCLLGRKNLNNIEGFDPYKIFRKIDNDCTNFITEYNIINFLESNSIYCTEKEARKFIKFYDNNASGKLSYSQFLNIIIENGNNSLHKINNSISLNSNLPYQIEYAVCRIIEREINLVRNLDSLIDELKQKKEFNIYDIFYVLNEMDEVSSSTLKKIFMKHKINFNDDDIKRILKRCDIDKDNHVTFNDIQKIFMDDYVINDNNNKSKSYINENYKIKKINSRNFNYSTNYTTLKDSNHNIYNYNNNLDYCSNVNKTYPEEQKNQNKNFSKTKISDTLNLIDIPKRKFSPEQNNNDSDNLQFKLRENLRKTNSERILQFLKLLMDTELQVENVKKELSLRSDFNLKDVFDFFEPKHYNFLTDEDLKLGFQKLKLFSTDTNIKLLIKKYDLKNNGLLEYDDFVKMIIPFELEYKNIMEKKVPSSNICKFNKSFFLTETTLSLMKSLFDIIITSELLIEKERHELNQIYDLDLRKCFDEIDKKRKGYFTFIDLKNYFNKNNIPIISKEIDLLFIRFDRKRIGEVDLLSFLYEFIPKTYNSNLN